LAIKAMVKRPYEFEVLECSFCRKTQNDVRKLVAGPDVFICNECVAICNDLMVEEARLEEAALVADGNTPNLIPESSVSGPMIGCALCSIPMNRNHGLPILNRGVLCVGCLGEIEAALALRRECGS